MQKLRTFHLYLGCIFAPMLLFFAVSGIWQTLGFGGAGFLRALSSIHTSHPLESDSLFLSRRVMAGFVLVMSMSFIITTLLGVVMAVKFGRSRRETFGCLAFGVLFPLVLVLVRFFSR